MAEDSTADLTMLVRQQRQIITELGSIRDDLSVLTAGQEMLSAARAHTRALDAGTTY